MGERACRARRALAPARVADTAVGQEGGPQSAESRAAARPTIGASAARPDAATASGRSHWEPASSQWEVPLGACKLPVGFPVGPRQVPLGARVGLSKRASKSEWEHGGSASVVPLGPSAFGEAPSPSPTRRREAHPACSHWEAAPLPCARHFLFPTSVQLKMSNRDFSKTARRNTYF